MTCPVCGGDTHIGDTWQFDVETTLRRRYCKECGHMFHTKEEECANFWGDCWRNNTPRRKAGRKATWDIAKGKEMYDAGHSYSEIARALGTTYNVVSSYAYTYWTPQRRER